ncbi:MAG: hypothetical protein ACYC46_10835 [Acidobacteriaceae bacterium]
MPVALLLAVFGGACTVALAQDTPQPQSGEAPSGRRILLPDAGNGMRRTRLYLKDGSYQIVTKYEVKGDRVRYMSAERGDWEEVPSNLVDWDATHKWEKAHAPGAALQTEAPEAPLSPEDQKEEAEDEALMPEVAHGLFLPADGGVFVLDTFQNAPELVELNQSTGDIDHSTGHNILKAVINPLSSPHELIQLRGNRARTQLHVAQPVFYVSIGPDVPLDAAPGAFKIDTHGASSGTGVSSNGSTKSQYVIVRASIRRDTRTIGSFRISLLGQVSHQEDVMETQAEILPGGHWLKLMPTQPLEIGEYALMEVLSEKDVNLDVWDFGVHPTAPENQNQVQPLKHRPQY